MLWARPSWNGKTRSAGFYWNPPRAPPQSARQRRGRAMVTGCGVPPAGIWRGDFSMMRGDGEVTWNNGPGASSRSPSARKSAPQITAGTPHPAQPAHNQPLKTHYGGGQGTARPTNAPHMAKSDWLLAAALSEAGAGRFRAYSAAPDDSPCTRIMPVYRVMSGF